MKISKLKQALLESQCEVVFTKADGSERVMQCTLMDSIVPTTVVNPDKPERKVNPDVQPVWDTEAQAWRAFRWDSLKSLNIIS